MNKRIIVALVSGILAFSFVGCTGPQGPIGATGPNGTTGENGPQGSNGTPGATGPQGPNGTPGATGPQGPNGTPGATGPQGPTGTANVIYSAWKPAAANWNNITRDNTTSKSSFILAPEVTQTVIDSALIMVYARFAGGDTLTFSLPHTSYAGSAVSTISAQAQLETTEPIGYTPVPSAPAVAAGAAVPAANQARIRLFRFTHDNSASVAVSAGGTYRYIIVPGGIAAAASANSKGLNWQDYSSVKRYFNLPD